MKIEISKAIGYGLVLTSAIFGYGMMSNDVSNIKDTYVTRNELSGQIQTLEAKINSINETVNRIWEIQQKSK